MDIISYSELRKQSKVFAREVIRKVLNRNNGNVSKTASIMGITRNTVRRARDGSLEDESRRPKKSPNKTYTFLENLIVKEASNTGFRYRRLSGYLNRKYSLNISEDTIKAILKRNSVEKKKKRAYNGKNRSLYDYENLLPFYEFQLDTKHILDKNALPESVYKHISKYGLPLYEWNMIDIATRARFTAYSYELNATYGYAFIVFCMLWLRAHNVRNKIRIRMDNGMEFCGGSAKKLSQWNDDLSRLNVELYTIPPGAKHLMGVIENSHRFDDEYFFIIHTERCFNTKSFLYKAQKWQDTWNFAKPNFGKGMDGLTPTQKLKKFHSLINEYVLLFPTILMENLFKYAYFILQSIMLKSGGQYVYTKCLLPLLSCQYDNVPFAKNRNVLC
ncbi:MAG: Bacterial regulatory protein, Fis family [Candidatus Methanofastidiosum methylothiophilum]|uniref:Bacterial regulatory protein, Fis family n=1 Tax=Candidatus Methanofastidiosum methylothiophilum TaxID=1705564 RepID=A0A150IJJ7_9EURY|nr:MAG: Bacterial regulatory protein, Fis family [Candidatus Methanofastidiosum methylthiophilus]